MKKNKLKEQLEQSERLLESAINELRFANMSIDYLYTTLDEIESMTTDSLSKQVVKNAKERHKMDKMIHARNLFDTNL